MSIVYCMNRLKQIAWLKAMGVEYYCSRKEVVTRSSCVKTTNDSMLNIPILATNDPKTLARSIADKVTSLDELKDEVMNFNACVLKQFANNTVFADGNKNAKIMCIGEAPGATEDKIGIPFCGESGKLLDNMFRAINLSRETNIYITNTVFWRPPGNREPTQEEIEICRPFLEKHIALIKPELIILIGSTAAFSLLGLRHGISKIKQEYYSYTNSYLTHSINVTAIFHPAYLLRQPMQKKTAWYDLLKIQEFIAKKSN